MQYRITRFTGLNQARHALLTDMAFAREAVNVDTRTGSLRRAKGFRPYVEGAHAGGIGTLMAFYKRAQGVSTKMLLAYNREHISVFENGAWRTVYQQGTGGDTASYLNYQANSRDILLVADGARGMLAWDGVNDMHEVAGCPAGFSQLALHYERVWGAGIAAEPDSVYWSRAYQPDDWTAQADMPDAGGGVLMIPTWNGASVVAIRALFDDVLVFKERDIYRIVGTYPGEYTVVRVHGSVGPVAPNTIVATADQCFFLAADGLCAYTGVKAAKVGGDEARNVLERVNPARAHKACATIHRGILYLALPLDASAENNAILELNLSEGAYTLREGVCVTSFLSFDGRLLASDGNGRVLEVDAGDTYAGGAIHSLWRTPINDMGTPGAYKRFQSLSLFGSGTVDITFETESGGSTRRVNLGDQLKPTTIPLLVNGFGLRLTFENVDGADFEIAPGATITYDNV